MRISAAVIIIAGLWAITPCSAREVSLHKHSADELKAACEKAGGSFTQDSSGFYCSSDCHGAKGTDCTIGCKTDQNCIAQVPGARRPTTLLNAVLVPSKEH